MLCYCCTVTHIATNLIVPIPFSHLFVHTYISFILLSNQQHFTHDTQLIRWDFPLFVTVKCCVINTPQSWCWDYVETGDIAQNNNHIIVMLQLILLDGRTKSSISMTQQEKNVLLRNTKHISDSENGKKVQALRHRDRTAARIHLVYRKYFWCLHKDHDEINKYYIFYGNFHVVWHYIITFPTAAIVLRPPCALQLHNIKQNGNPHNIMQCETFKDLVCPSIVFMPFQDTT